MQSARSYLSNQPKTAKAVLNFHKDIIMPTIYEPENYELIKNNNYPPRKVRKAVSAKSERIRSVIETIVSKKPVPVENRVPHFPHRPAKPPGEAKKRQLPVYKPVMIGSLTLDIDERLNEKALEYEEQAATERQRLKKIKQKLQQPAEETNPIEEQIEFYLTQVSHKKKQPLSSQRIYVTVNDSSPKYKGFVEEQEQIERSRLLRNRRQINTSKIFSVKQRPKSASSVSVGLGRSKITSTNYETVKLKKETGILFGTKSLLNTRLGRWSRGSEIYQNLHHKSRHEQSKQKCRNLIDQIQSRCLEDSLNKNGFIRDFNKLSMVWKTEKEFLEAQPSLAVMNLSQQTLELMISRRKKEHGISEIDENCMKQQKPLHKSQNNQNFPYS